jgi:peptide/nickel transport system ATP-binding protein
MGQRVMIAMMLIPEPDLLIADEPTSALDVTVQAEVLSILDDLVPDRGMGLIFISHDLRLVARFCDRVLVMYARAAWSRKFAPATFLRRSIPIPAAC